jgi:hypothetical protein
MEGKAAEKRKKFKIKDVPKIITDSVKYSYEKYIRKDPRGKAKKMDYKVKRY